MDNLLFRIAQAIEPPSGSDFSLPEVEANSSTVESVLAIVFGAAAAVAILVIVIAALNIATGGGEPEKISKGKKTIVLALVGLAVAVTGQFIVQTILNRI